MQEHKKAFIHAALKRGALRLGSFTLKSGRESPYFFNTGAFDSGAALQQLGGYYAAAIDAADLEFDVVFGPAYKGIPLATAVAIALSRDYGCDVPFCFNRKEAKDHGEGGITVGAALVGRVLIVDDVISSGTSVDESIRLIRAAGAEPVAVIISLDRLERGESDCSAAQEVRQAHGIAVASIATLHDVIAYLRGQGGHEQVIGAIEAYRSAYGVDGP